MFNSGRDSGGNGLPDIQTFIGKGTVIDGDVSFEGGLHVDGKVTGAITGQGDNGLVSVSEHGEVNGSIKSPRIVINGTLNGDAMASNRLELEAKAKVNGNMSYQSIQMELGAEVNGGLTKIDNHQPAKALPKPEPKPVEQSKPTRTRKKATDDS